MAAEPGIDFVGLAAIIDKARTSWLKNNEVLDLLEGFQAAGMSVCSEPPVRPEGGNLFLYDRRSCRFFRRDGHNWRKKPDGKTIRETHEKLKVGNAETLNCYYAHADQEDGLQRRCYWQLDPSKEHIVLVHYLCTSSSRAGGGAGGRTSSAELSGEAAVAVAAPTQRPKRNSARPARAYSPPPATAGRRGAGGSQPKLSPMVTQPSLGASLGGGDASGSGSLLSQGSDAASMQLPLPLVGGMTLEAAAALPSLAQQYALAQQQQQQLMAAARGGNGGTAAATAVDFDPFELPASEGLARPHPGVLYTDQRVASQHLAAAQAFNAGVGASAGLAAAPLPPLPPFGGSVALPRLFHQGSFGEQHRGLFREMSLGIQRETTDEPNGFTLSPTERSLDPMGGDSPAPPPRAGAGGAAGPSPGGSPSKLTSPRGSGGSGGSGAGTPGAELAALLASPPHNRGGGGGGHARTFSRQGSGLSRLISKNWESELQSELLMDMLQEVDADLSSLPVDSALLEDEASSERPSSPSSRLVDHAGIAFFGSAATAQHTLEPSPLAAAGLPPIPQHAELPPLPGVPISLGGGADAAARFLHFASPLQQQPPQQQQAAVPGSLQFVAAGNDGSAVAHRSAALKERQAARGGAGAAGMPRSGSHPHLAHLTRRSAGPGGLDAAAEEQEQQRRRERVDAAASAAQEHRDEQLAARRNQRAMLSSEDAEEAQEMIQVPDEMMMHRLSSFLHQRGSSTGSGIAAMVTSRGPSSGREAAAAAALAEVAEEEQAAAVAEAEARHLFKHMSIDEVDAVAAVQAAAKELQVMPTIPASGSSELEVASATSHPGSLSEEINGSRQPSVNSLLEAMQMHSPKAAGAAPVDPAVDSVGAQLQQAFALHAARAATAGHQQGR